MYSCTMFAYVLMYGCVYTVYIYIHCTTVDYDFVWCISAVSLWCLPLVTILCTPMTQIDWLTGTALNKW